MSDAAAPEADQILGMSDEDFLNLDGPPEGEGDVEAAATVVDKNEGKDADDGAEGTGAAAEPDKAKDEGDLPNVEVDPDKPAGEPDDDDQGKAKDEANPSGAEKKDTKDKKADPSPGSEESQGFTPPSNEEAQSFFMKVMAPIKANGKLIQLKSPDEAIQLMQMGANYTRKLQDIAPYRKTLLMLEKNGLLDEGKLSFLIDIDRKDPEAIKKLIKDAGIDPMDIDTSTDPAYADGNHIVSEEEAGFHQALQELTASPTGQETVRLINDRWDHASKQLLWRSPEVLSIIHSQRENGVYDLISAEMDRQITLGQIPPNTPFIQAYKAVGDQLMEANAFAHLGGGGLDPNPQDTQPKPDPVAVDRPVNPKADVENGDQASAASPTRGTPREAKKLVNVLAMSDEEFLTQFQGRL